MFATPAKTPIYLYCGAPLIASGETLVIIGARNLQGSVEGRKRRAIRYCFQVTDFVLN